MLVKICEVRFETINNFLIIHLIIMKKFFKILMVFALLGGATLSCTKDYSQEVVDLKAQDENLKATIATLQSAVDAANKTINDLKANKADVSALEAAKNALQAQIDALTEKLNKQEEIHKADIERLDAAVKGINEEITAINAAIAKINATDARQDEEIKALGKKVEEYYSELSAAISANKAAIAQLQADLDNLTAVVKSLEDRVEAYYRELGEKIDALAARIQSLVADAPVDASEINTLVWGDFQSSASQSITYLDMTFTVTPAECAEALNEDNVEVIVTEGLNVTRAADKDEAYAPTKVTVDPETGKVTVHANINQKTSLENAYWVALKVKGEDEAGEIAKMSQFVKATEGTGVRNVFSYATWYDKQARKAVAENIIYLPTVHMPWKANVKNGVAVETPNVMTYTEKDIFGNYEIRFEMPNKELWTAAQVAELFGIEDVEVSAPATPHIYDAAGKAAAAGSYEAKTLTFTPDSKDSNNITFNAEFPEANDLKNRELVGSSVYVAYGAIQLNVEEGFIEDLINWIREHILKPVVDRTLFNIQIGDQTLKGFGIVYTADIVKNTVHSQATDTKIDYAWDYIHYDHTGALCQVFENCVWSFKDVSLTYADLHWSRTDAIYDAATNTKITDAGAYATLKKTAIDMFTFGIENVKFGATARNLYAAYTEDDSNAANIIYTTYSTDIPFTVEPRHADVAKELAATITPKQTKDGKVTFTKGPLALAFADDVPAWVGVEKKTAADLFAAFKAVNATINPAKVTEDGVDVTAKKASAITLNFDYATATDKSEIAYAAGTFDYGKTYVLTFNATAFGGVKFTWTVTLTTNESPFALVTTPIVKVTEDANTVVLQGRSQTLNKEFNGVTYKQWFTFEQAHFNKYLEVSVADKAAFADEAITLDFVDAYKPEGHLCYQYSDDTKALLEGVYNTGNFGKVDFSALKASAAGALKPEGGLATFEDNAILNWVIDDVTAFRGRKVEVMAYLKVGNTVVDKKLLTFVPEEPVLSLTATKEIELQRVPGEDSVVDLFSVLSVNGVYDGYKAQLLTETTPKSMVYTWANLTVPTPFYQTELVIAPVKEWTVTLNGEKFSLTDGINYKFADPKNLNQLTLIQDNNAGTLVMEIPVTLKSCLDTKAVTYKEFEKIGQAATIKVTATTKLKDGE